MHSKLVSWYIALSLYDKVNQDLKKVGQIYNSKHVESSTLYGKNMLALCAWVGCSLKQDKHALINVFCKLGGKYLGKVGVESQLGLLGLVRSLQVQISKLFVHPTRTSNYLVLELDGLELPSFTYREEFEPAFEVGALVRLAKITRESRLECMYDEDDSFALSCVKSQHAVSTTSFYDTKMSYTNGTWVAIHGELGDYFGVLKFTHNPTHLELASTWADIPDLRCSVLASFSNLEALRLRANVTVMDWEFASKLCLTQLEVNNYALKHVDFTYLPSLETLVLDCNEDDYLDLDLGKQLPKSLKYINFSRHVPRNLASRNEDTKQRFLGVEFWFQSLHRLW